MFVLQLGSATFLLTEPVISAMTTGAATHVVTSQVKYLLGIKMPYISGPLGFFYVSFMCLYCLYSLGICFTKFNFSLLQYREFAVI